MRLKGLSGWVVVVGLVLCSMHVSAQDGGGAPVATPAPAAPAAGGLADKQAGTKLAEDQGTCDAGANDAIKKACNERLEDLFAQVIDLVGNNACDSATPKLPALHAQQCSARAKALSDAKSRTDCANLHPDDKASCEKKFPDKPAATDGFSWKNAGFGIGVGATFDGEPNIKDAQVVDGVVRVLDEEKHSRGLWLETHLQVYKCGWFAVGPFVAAQVDGDNVFEGLGAGIMFLGSRGDKTNLAFNIGIGYASVPVRVLGDGIEDGEPLPGMETQVRFKDTDDERWLLLFSFDFVSGRGVDSNAQRAPGSGS
ncbi:MAG: hypothetical protein WC809_09895 [Sinimarinibacterium sp.]|jgi:hypothetical protein